LNCYDLKWKLYLIPLGTWLVIYSIVIPIAMFVILKRYRQRFDLRFLHSGYKDEYYYWECIEVGRKMVLLIINIFNQEFGTMYMTASISLIVSAVYLAIFSRVSPYIVARDHYYKIADLIGTILFYLWISDIQDNVFLSWLIFIYGALFTLVGLSFLLYKVVRMIWEKYEMRKKVKDNSSSNGTIDGELLELIKKY